MRILFLNTNSVSVANVELHGIDALRILGELRVQLPYEVSVGVRLGGVDDGAAPECVVKSDGAPGSQELQNPLVVIPVIWLQFIANGNILFRTSDH